VPSAPRPAPAARRSPRPGGSRLPLRLLTLALGAVCLLAGLALPLAPVERDRPVVTWPQDPAAVESTALPLTAYRPAALDVAVGCAAVAEVAAAGGGTVLATVDPAHPSARAEGLVWEVDEGVQRLTVAGDVLLKQDVAADAGCGRYRLVGDGEGLELFRDDDLLAAPTGRVDVPAEPGLEPPPAGGPAALSTSLPSVDLVETSLAAVGDDPSAADVLSVRLLLDDRGASTPAPTKVVLLVLLLLASAALLVLAAREDSFRRGRPTLPAAPRRRRPRRPRAVDVALVLALVVWLPLAPMTDDDGYYASMAAAVRDTGYVSQYYQLWGQSFVPLSWPWYALGWWVDLGGRSVVWLRLPALALGVTTWVALRAVLGRTALGRGPLAGRLRWVLAVTFWAAWAPFSMGVRPEAVGAATSALVLLLVLVTAQTGRLLPMSGAVLLVSASLAAHPTGAVALAPLLAGSALVLPPLLAGRGLVEGLRRTVLVVVPGAVAVALGFADGTLDDFVSNRALFAATEESLGWTDEVRRYGLLLADIPMGAFAKRTAVLLGLVAVAWAVVLVAALGRSPRRAPRLLHLVTWSALLAHVALWVTPSKWTHHFGALAGTVPLLVALVVVLGPTLARRATAGRPGPALSVALVAGVVATVALGLSGPNAWPYMPEIGILGGGLAPSVGGVPLSSPALWLALALVVVAVAAARRRAVGARAATAAAVVVVVALATSSAYMAAAFARQAQVALADGTWAPGAAALADPTARRCDAGSALQVVDDRSAVPLAAVPPSADRDARLDGFVAGGGWWPGSPPPQPVGGGLLGQVWGSLDPDEATEGELVSPWYALPGDGRDVAVTSAGRQVAPGSVVLETGATQAGGAVEVLGTQDVSDGEDVAQWRVALLDDAPDGADVVRVRAADTGSGTGGWVAVSAPAAVSWTDLADLGGSSEVGVSWQAVWHFSCLRQPVVAAGVTRLPALAVAYGGEGYEGLGDNTWQPFRGGLFGHLDRSTSLLRLPSRFEGREGGDLLAVLRVSPPRATEAYELGVAPETTSGLEGPSTDAW